ncbi:MAG: carboxypeptidase-like regulatory domain-containing protein [Myxococcota bacterium]
MGASATEEEPRAKDSSHTGVVVDTEGRPVVDAQVRWWQEEVRTDAEGRFTLPPDARAPSSIRAEHPEFGVAETVESFWSRPTELVRLELRPVTRLRGRVVGADGAEIRDGYVWWEFYREGSSWSDSARLQSDGSVVSDPFFTRFPRRIRVAFRSESHSSHEIVVRIEPGDDTDFGLVTLPSAPPRVAGANLSGQVIGPLTGANIINPIAAVQRDGTFVTAKELRPGVHRPKWIALEGRFDRLVAFGPAITLEPGEHRTGYRIEARPDASLEAVLLEHDGRAVALTTLVICTERTYDRENLRRDRRGGHVQTDRDGRFRIDALVPGPYFIAIPRADFLKDGYFDVDDVMEPIELELQPGLNRHELRLPDPRFIAGSIQPVPGLRATLHGTSQAVLEIGADGRFRFERAGVKHVVFEAEGWQPLVRVVPIDPLAHWAGLSLSRGNLVDGVVEGAARAEIRLRRRHLPDLVAYTDARGRFSLDTVPFGSLEFDVRAPGHPAQTVHYDPQRPKFIRVRFGSTPAPLPSDPR